MVRGSRGIQRISQELESSHFVPYDRASREVAVNEPMVMQELESHGYIPKHPIGLGAREWALLEHFAEQQTWHGLANSVKVLECGSGADPTIQVG